MSGDRARPEVSVKRFELVKRDARGRVFEVLEGGDGRPTVATFRRPGEPAESYAEVPYQPKELFDHDPA